MMPIALGPVGATGMYAGAAGFRRHAPRRPPPSPMRYRPSQCARSRKSPAGPMVSSGRSSASLKTMDHAQQSRAGGPGNEDSYRPASRDLSEKPTTAAVVPSSALEIA